jgi:class 3 adenylate cyclase
MSEERDLAIGFSDLRGFTSYTAKRGDQQAFQMAQTFSGLVGEQVARHGGRVLKTYGDGVMTSFDEVESALQSVSAMQRSLSDFNQTQEEPLSAGIGLAWGSVLQTEDDVFGHSVNVAKRLADAAKGGQIIVSSSVCEQARAGGTFSFRSIGERTLKGLGAHSLYELVWRDEVATLSLTDDTLDLVLTNDDTLVLEFAKPIAARLRAVQDKLLAAETKGAPNTLRGKMAKRLLDGFPKFMDAAQRWAGMGIEHPLDQVNATLSKGRLHVVLPTGKPIRFAVSPAEQESAQRFVDSLLARKRRASQNRAQRLS